jgi:4-hydroxyphenylpyruvate dioxygenase
MHYGGILNRTRHAERIEEMHFWMLLAKRLRTDLIQIPSSFLPESECTNDLDMTIQDMTEIADLGLTQSPPIRFCYEALCWGTHIDLWEQAWEVVNKVNRPNFGTCLDTFNLCGRVYADPASPSGVNENAEADMQRTIALLRSQLDAKKIFYVEVVDGERLEQPVTERHPFYVPGQKARMSWSRNARLFPLETKGYLPVIETLEAILECGYTGYISFEFFSRTANDASPNVPEQHAKRAEESWRRLCERMGWENGAKPTPQELQDKVSQSAPQHKPQNPFASSNIVETVTPRSFTPMLEAH